ncbi:phosphate signaling complex protein PhoU [Ligilactobacillus equi]|uniref:Phosphate-specific transport system accessory protein PhoU n=1 Tax=Ligilactobacillus equi DSM 15833 = JCM 10991 TaxID=1423740 RepID=A0A0R1TL12_9LACO|nr:phosphate signaling complex protein PhoU [Ligilactobacillus equi]KRL81888.1 phosphate regulatory protein [Ligilactobacillus equi DSM 15833 = JCM 10991]
MNEIFADEQKKLRGRFMEMGIDASEQIYLATKSFIDKDIELAQKVKENDDLVNEEELALEKRALKVMALQQPLAADFRTVITILKASSDVERIADHAVHIARETILVDALEEKLNSQEIDEIISQMTVKLRRMLENILDAYLKTDEQNAYEVANCDLEIDRLYIQGQKIIIEKMKDHPKGIEMGSHYLTIIRLLERIGDHIVNLAEWIIYSVTGRITELNPGKANPVLVKDQDLK